MGWKWPKIGWVKDYAVADPLDILSPVDLVNGHLLDAYGGVHRMCVFGAPTTDVFSAARLNDLQDVLVALLTRLPESVPEVEVSWTANGDYRDTIRAHQELRQEGVLGAMRQSRCQKMHREIDLGKLIGCETHLSFGTVWLARDKGGKRSLRRPAGPEELETATLNLQAALETAKGLVTRFGGTIRPMDDTEVATYYYRLMNPEEAIDQRQPLRYDPDRTPFADAWMISEVALEPHPYEGKGLIRWGNLYHAVVTLTGKPLQSTPRMMDAVTTLLNHRQIRYTVRVRMLDQVAERDRLKHIQDAADQDLQNPTNLFERLTNPYEKNPESGKRNIEAQERLDEANALIADLRTGAEVLVEAQAMWHLWSRNPDELLYRRDRLLTRLADLGGSRGYAERHGVMVALANSLPNAGGPMLEPKRYRARMAADLIPLNRGFETGDRPVAIFRNAAGGLVPVDLWDTRNTTAPMVFISGKTGSGKSMLANHLIATHALPGVRVMILDFGGSYQTLSRLLSIPVFALDPKEPRVLNPFQLFGITADEHGVVKVPDAGTLAKVKAAIMPLFVRPQDPGGRIPDEWQTFLSMALEGTFNEGRDRGKPLVTLTDLDKRLERFRESKGLRTRLKPYLRGEEYGAWLDGPTDWRLDHPFFVLDLRGIRSLPELSRALIPLAMSVIYQLATQERGTPKLLIFEELWQQLDSPEVLDFAIEAFKTLRKEGAAVVGISQSIADLQSNERAALAISQCVQTWFLFEQGDEDSRKVAIEKLKMTSGESQILRELGSSLRLREDQTPEIYRECLLLRGEGEKRQAGRLRVQLESEEYWLYTSEPNEHRKREQALQACGSVALAVQTLAREYPLGLMKNVKQPEPSKA